MLRIAICAKVHALNFHWPNNGALTLIGKALNPPLTKQRISQIYNEVERLRDQGAPYHRELIREIIARMTAGEFDHE